MTLAGVVALDPVCLVPADVEPADRDQIGVDRPVVGAVQPRPPAPYPLQQPLEGSSIAIAALPAREPPLSTIPSLPHPELVGLLLR